MGSWKMPLRLNGMLMQGGAFIVCAGRERGGETAE